MENSGYIDKARETVPFIPPSKYVDVGGRKLTRSRSGLL